MLLKYDLLIDFRTGLKIHTNLITLLTYFRIGLFRLSFDPKLFN